MNLLFLNWKDSKHPLAGGAEYVTHEYAKHLVKRGHEVTLFTSHAHGLKKEEISDGIKIIRRGNLYTVYFWAFISYLFSLRQYIDIVIDQIHGVPFFTPLFVRKPILAWIHEIAGDIWAKEFRFPVSFIGPFFEQWYSRLYKRLPFLCDTSSTQKELITLGIPSSHITVLSLTTDHPQFNHQKTRYPTLVYVGRVSPMKQVEYLIRATSLLVRDIPQLKTIIAGPPKKVYVEMLKRLVQKLHLEKQVAFLGGISEAKKWHLLSSAWIHVHPSLKEGFGLTVLEAARSATPTVSFKVPGLSDTVKNEINGQIVPQMSVSALADTLYNLIINPRKLKKISQSAYTWSRDLPSWDQQTRKLEQLLETVSTKQKSI